MALLVAHTTLLEISYCGSYVVCISSVPIAHNYVFVFLFIIVDAILRFAAVWNTNSRHCHEAQFVLSTILKSYPPLELRKFPNIKASLEGLIPYTGKVNYCAIESYVEKVK